MLRRIVHDHDGVAVNVVSIAGVEDGTERQPSRERDKRAGYEWPPTAQQTTGHLVIQANVCASGWQVWDDFHSTWCS
jgi:hypothetical protein